MARYATKPRIIHGLRRFFKGSQYFGHLRGVRRPVGARARGFSATL